MSKDDRKIYFHAYVQPSFEQEGSYQIQVADSVSEQLAGHVFVSAVLTLHPREGAEFDHYGIYSDLIERYGDAAKKFLGHIFQTGLSTGLNYKHESEARKPSLN